MIEQIIQKRTDLINFFLNQKNTYTKEEILNKEFSVLSFSPSEEYIDVLKSPFDDICVDLSTYTMLDTSEVYIKGIIVDIDRQSYQTIIHLQNKDSIMSVTCKGATLQKYEDFFIMGEPVIAKCSVFNERMYLSFLILLNSIDKFEKECSYIQGHSRKKIENVMSDKWRYSIHYGLIIECSMVKTKKGKDMLRGTIYDGKENRSFGSVKTSYNPSLPTYAVAGDYVRFNRPTREFLINNMEVVDL